MGRSGVFFWDLLHPKCYTIVNVRSGPGPIWKKGQRAFAIHNIVCAIDLSAHNPKTVQWAAQLAAEFGARLTLVHINPEADVYGPDGFDFGPAWKEGPLRSAAQQIAKLHQEMGTKAEVFIESGDVPKLLDQAAKQNEADVQVIGRPPHGRLRATGYGIRNHLGITHSRPEHVKSPWASQPLSNAHASLSRLRSS